jgi:hypothetical protein
MVRALIERRSLLAFVSALRGHGIAVGKRATAMP